ncbi:hypothetical protein K7432_012100 [Basidiobolus ranarum]|uniref:Cyclase n=1 Tax=Basidiobolus ranarum TaxID=34480 RepID=A0ABR2VTM5_9FUNG
MSLPDYDHLPINSKYPGKTAWGVWGEEDSLGTLNKVTTEATTKAAQCVKKGQYFPLNWEMEKPHKTLLGRPTLKHRLKPLTPTNLAFDDEYDDFNTQASSQWDELNHFCYIAAGKYYNNIDASEMTPEKENHGHKRLGIHHVARRGIATRAVLLDYGRWAQKNRPDFDPFQRNNEITVEELDKVAKAQKVTFRQGDILLLRTGWITKHDQLGENFATEIPDPIQVSSAGVKAGEDTFAWMWNHHFAAVAADNVAFEAWPPADMKDSCHSLFLGGWGMPIGELFYLDALAESSAEDGIYEYFFTSAPLNKYQGVASPPNALCIK